jgi:hypothetical protein
LRIIYHNLAETTRKIKELECWSTGELEYWRTGVWGGWSEESRNKETFDYKLQIGNKTASGNK